MADQGYTAYNLGHVFKLRDELLYKTCCPFAGIEPTHDDLLNLVDEIKAACPADVQRDAIYQTVLPALGHELTVGRLETLCWRIAGNIPRLKQGIPVYRWTVQQGEEWVPIEVQRAEPWWVYGERRVRLAMMILAGSPCPRLTRVVWTTKMCWVISWHVGFSKPKRGPTRPAYPYRAAADLVGLRFYVKLTPERSRREPGFDETYCPPAMVQRNRKDVLRLRCRHKVQCPRGYLHPCHLCAVGYLECPAGTHRETYTHGFCTGCGRQTYFDPEEASDVCIDCTYKARRWRHS